MKTKNVTILFHMDMLLCSKDPPYDYDLVVMRLSSRDGLDL
jgi:hypothetical protein